MDSLAFFRRSLAPGSTHANAFEVLYPRALLQGRLPEEARQVMQEIHEEF